MSDQDTERIVHTPTTKVLRAIVLDADGVIADTMRQHIKAIQRTLREYGHDNLASVDFTKQLKQGSSDRIFRKLIIQNNLVDRANLDGKDFQSACNKKRDEFYKTKTEFYLQEIENDIASDIPGRKLAVRPGIDELLVEGSDANLPLAIASASNMEAVGKLVNRLGIDGFFRTKVCHKPHVKPDPHSYISAMQACGVGRSQYHQCLAIEDTRNGALSSLAAGMQVVIVKSSFTDIADDDPIINKGIERDTLRDYRRRSLPEEDIAALERLEKNVPYRKVGMVMENLADYVDKVLPFFKEHNIKTTSLLHALDDVVAGFSSLYKT